MALNGSGPISLAGATAGQSIAIELGQSATGQISLNDAAVRALAGVASGAIVMPTNFYGKSSAFTTLTVGTFYEIKNPVKVVSAAFCALTSTRGLIMYTESDAKGIYYRDFAVVVDISGTVITVYSSVIMRNSYTGTGWVNGVTAIDSTSVLYTGGIYVSLVVLFGTAPSRTSFIDFENSDTPGRNIGILTSTTYLVGLVYSSQVCANVVSRSGNTLTRGTTVRLSTGLTASGVQVTTAVSNSTTGAIAFRNRVYPVTVSGTTPTIDSGYVTAPGSNNGSSGIGLSPISGGNYLVAASPLDGGSVTCVVLSQSGSSLTLNTSRTFTYSPGQVPATMDCMVYSGGASALVRTTFSDYMVVNISGTTISATKTNNVTGLALFLVCGSLSSTQTVLPSWVGSVGPMRAAVLTTS